MLQQAAVPLHPSWKTAPAPGYDMYINSENILKGKLFKNVETCPQSNVKNAGE